MGALGARSGLCSPWEGYPAYGAVHEVLPTQELSTFMYNFRRIADSVFDIGPPQVRIEGFDVEPSNGREDETSDYDSRKFYKAFDIDTLGVSVVEMDPSQKAAKKIRKIWERQDYGVVAQEARTGIDRQFGIEGQTPMRLSVDHVDGIGGKLPSYVGDELRQKLALIADVTQYQETISKLDYEAEEIMGAINRRLDGQVVYPWDRIVHVTFAAFRADAQPRQVRTVIDKTNQHLAKKPLTVKLGKLEFRYKKSRKG